MARSAEAGNMPFGLVSPPVRLSTSTSSHSIRFHQLQRREGAAPFAMRQPEYLVDRAPAADIAGRSQMTRVGLLKPPASIGPERGGRNR
ncbi:hypothetical protein OV450_0056 [Actinobacteria bacterium OV450]|nr:hypothetical protein OV450_0056 [Actinobacteria bacterium OV450]